MTLSLSEALMTYFAVSNGAEMARLAPYCAATTVVSDEGQACPGRDAILSWPQSAQQTHPYSVDPRHVALLGKEGTVVAEVVGFCSGSPVSLPPMFTRVGNKVFYRGSRR